MLLSFRGIPWQDTFRSVATGKFGIVPFLRFVYYPVNQGLSGPQKSMKVLAQAPKFIAPRPSLASFGPPWVCFSKTGPNSVHSVAFRSTLRQLREKLLRNGVLFRNSERFVPFATGKVLEIGLGGFLHREIFRCAFAVSLA
jgi:hypothetical protein